MSGCNGRIHAIDAAQTNDGQPLKPTGAFSKERLCRRSLTKRRCGRGVGPSASHPVESRSRVAKRLAPDGEHGDGARSVERQWLGARALLSRCLARAPTLRGHVGPSSSSGFAMTTPGRCGFLQPWPLLIKAGLGAVFAQQRPRKPAALSRADPSSLAGPKRATCRSGLGLYGEHGSVERRGASCFCRVRTAGVVRIPTGPRVKGGNRFGRDRSPALEHQAPFVGKAVNEGAAFAWLPVDQAFFDQTGRQRAKGLVGLRRIVRRADARRRRDGR